MLNSTKNIVEFVTSNYGLAEENTATLLSIGVENNNYLIVAGKDEYVFRVYSLEHSIKGFRDIDSITQELLFMEHARQSGLLVPKIITASDGKMVSTIKNKSRYHSCILLQKIQGTHPQYITEHNVLQISELVSKMFAVSRNFTLQTKLIEFDILTRAQSSVRKIKPDSKHANSIMQIFNSVDHDTVENQKTGLIHGDIKLENVLVDEENIALLDFDDCRNSFLSEDITMTLMHNLHSKSQNIIRAGFYEKFTNYVSNKELKSIIQVTLRDMLRVRFVYDLCKYSLSGKDELIDELLNDPYIAKHILKK